MKRDKDGYLYACLLSKNETQVEVQFGFKLVNHDEDEYAKRFGRAYHVLPFSGKRRFNSKHAGK